jgi:hypothetical protein
MAQHQPHRRMVHELDPRAQKSRRWLSIVPADLYLIGMGRNQPTQILIAESRQHQPPVD